MTDRLDVVIVVPTIGRPALSALLASLANEPGSLLRRTIVVDDRRDTTTSLEVPKDARVLRSCGRGPAAARNVGWRAADATWIVFLDDSVRVAAGWGAALRDDLATAGDEIAVLPGNVVTSKRSRAATRDMAYRRDALLAVGGFDEGVRASHEDVELEQRVREAGWQIHHGTRSVFLPVRPLGTIRHVVRECVGFVRDVLTRGDARSVREPDVPVEAVLLDRDGTLVVDVPFNRDRVVPIEGVPEALRMLRAAHIPTAVITNESGIARGLVRPEDLTEVHRRMEEQLGPLGPLVACPHGPDEGCRCQKTGPGLVVRAASVLGVDPRACMVVGDTSVDLRAARAAGMRSILVPNELTLRREIDEADEVAPSMLDAARVILEEPPSVRPRPSARLPGGDGEAELLVRTSAS